VGAGIDGNEMASKANRLAKEQAALRRVATLVASSAKPKQVFQMVAEEAGRLLEARTAATMRFDPDSGVIAGSWNDGEGAGLEVGTLFPTATPLARRTAPRTKAAASTTTPTYPAKPRGWRVRPVTDLP
jgi:hypothetical protein